MIQLNQTLGRPTKIKKKRRKRPRSLPNHHRNSDRKNHNGLFHPRVHLVRPHFFTCTQPFFSLDAIYFYFIILVFDQLKVRLELLWNGLYSIFHRIIQNWKKSYSISLIDGKIYYALETVLHPTQFSDLLGRNRIHGLVHAQTLFQHLLFKSSSYGKDAYERSSSWFLPPTTIDLFQNCRLDSRFHIQYRSNTFHYE